MRRVQREYRIAVAVGATLALFVGFVIWSSGAGGGSASRDTQFPADELSFAQPSSSEPTEFDKPQEWTAASTTSRLDEALKSAAKIDPRLSVGVVPHLPGLTGDQAAEQAADIEIPVSADSDNRAGVASWNNSGPASGQSARSATATGARSYAGGSLGGASASAGAKTRSAQAGDVEASRQGLADSAPAEDTQAPRASAARTDNHASTLPESPGPAVQFSTAPNDAVAQSPAATVAPVFNPVIVPDNASGPAFDLTLDGPESTLSDSLLPGADPSNLLLPSAAGAASFDSTPAVENPRLNPEPTSLLLLGTGLGLLARRLKRRERRPA